MRTNPILQEHTFGCGVACVAYGLDVTYKKALALFKHPGYAWTRGYYCRELIAALAAGGSTYRHFRFRLKHRPFLFKPSVIVYTRRSHRYPAGHYLIRTRNGAWMNPWANYPSISPVKGALQKKLPGSVSYILIPDKYLSKPRK